MKNNSPHSRTKDLSETLIRSSFPNTELRLDKKKKWRSPTFGWCFESTPIDKPVYRYAICVFHTVWRVFLFPQWIWHPPRLWKSIATLPSLHFAAACPIPSDFSLSKRCIPQTQPCLLHSCVWGSWFSSVSLLLQNGAPILSQGQGSHPYPTHVQLGLQRASSPCCGLSAFYWNSVSCMHTRIHSLCIIAPHNPSLKVLAGWLIKVPYDRSFTSLISAHRRLIILSIFRREVVV